MKRVVNCVWLESEEMILFHLEFNPECCFVWYGDIVDRKRAYFSRGKQIDLTKLVGFINRREIYFDLGTYNNKKD